MTKRRQSIQYKIWLAIMVTVIIAIGTLWIMQVVFLEYYYVMIKKANLQKDAFTVAKTISKNGITESVEDIMKLASEKTLCVDISTIDGINIFSVEGLGDNCFVHNNLDKKSTIFLETINNEGRFVVTEVSHPKYNTQFLISSAVITAKHGSKCVIMVTTTLAPITEAVSIIQTQLIYVTVILVLISLIISFIIARSITKPLRKISNAAKNIAKGNFDVDVSVDTQDELKDLSDSFNHMTKELSKVNILQKELIANISHDIRTPLTMIKGYAESIKDITGDNKEVRDNQL
ncbi:MAG: HAMP domain-containing protein, partial [Oscillospiraceae bacterium]